MMFVSLSLSPPLSLPLSLSLSLPSLPLPLFLSLFPFSLLPLSPSLVREVVSAVNEAISSGSRTSLLRALQMEGGKFKDVKPENMQWYMDFLSKAVSDKAESEVRVGEGSEGCFYLVLQFSTFILWQEH